MVLSVWLGRDDSDQGEEKEGDERTKGERGGKNNTQEERRETKRHRRVVLLCTDPLPPCPWSIVHP